MTSQAPAVDILLLFCIRKEEKDGPDRQDAPVNTVIWEDFHHIHAQNMICQNERDAQGNELYKIRTVQHHAQAHADYSVKNSGYGQMGKPCKKKGRRTQEKMHQAHKQQDFYKMPE